MRRVSLVIYLLCAAPLAAVAQDHGHHAHHMPADDAPVHVMSGVLGAYVAGRDASGTAWQPDETAHEGIHGQYGPWMLMGHARLTAVYDWQTGPRGDEKAFVAGMVMGSARRDLANGDTLQLRAMLSADPFMGKSGYPLLLQAGESADGVEHLVDRQHPHDLFMELSGTYSHALNDRNSVFAYVGWPGEPAFGPPVFMHRAAGVDNPEAPISHHWLDSTHITYGVITAGVVSGDWKVEASRFNGREPDEDRYDLEAPSFDSTAVRISWNPSAHWALQASWADVLSPEALEPDIDVIKWSASALYSRGIWSLTGAWGRKVRTDDVTQDAWLFEAAARPNADWVLFSRAEQVENDELDHGHMHTVQKFSVGALRQWRVRSNLQLGLGALYSRSFVPDDLDAEYGDRPEGVMVFIQAKMP